MISRIALRRLLHCMKHQALPKRQNSLFVVPRFIHTATGLYQCDNPIEPSLAETMSSSDEGYLESNLDIDEVLLQTAEAELNELPLEEKNYQDVDEGNFNYDEMLLDSAMDHSDFEVEDKEDKEHGGEENFNYDDMLLNSVVDDSGLDVGEDVDVDTFLSRQSDDIRADILGSALQLVPEHGWTMKSIEKAIEQLDIDSSTTTNMFKHEGLDLVLFFIEEANNSLIDYLAKQSKEKRPNTEEARAAFIEDAMKRRLQLIIPYIDTWPQALTLMASPQAAREVFENGANLMDEIWYHAGDMDTDLTWYAKRAALAAISASAELYMLNDKSPEFRDTWEFLHRRLNDARVAGGVKDSLSNAAGDTIALVSSGITTAQNILGLGGKGSRS